MQNTPNFALSYPEPGDHTRTWEYWQTLAVQLDTLIATYPRGIVAGTTTNTGVDFSAGGTYLSDPITTALTGGRRYSLLLIADIGLLAPGTVGDVVMYMTIDGATVLSTGYHIADYYYARVASFEYRWDQLSDASRTFRAGANQGNAVGTIRTRLRSLEIHDLGRRMA